MALIEPYVGQICTGVPQMFGAYTLQWYKLWYKLQWYRLIPYNGILNYILNVKMLRNFVLQTLLVNFLRNKHKSLTYLCILSLLKNVMINAYACTYKHLQNCSNLTQNTYNNISMHYLQYIPFDCRWLFGTVWRLLEIGSWTTFTPLGKNAEIYCKLYVMLHHHVCDPDDYYTLYP